MNTSEHLLTCLSEECAEVQHRVSKALRFGMGEIEPGQDLTNAQRIAQEFHDVLAIVEMLEERGILKRSTSFREIEEKKTRVQWWMDHAIRNGTLVND
ncbi:hypothetical protein EBAPG3_010350 [Nitrosospira lacus]|uniref:Uncharacterized protein n=1 Tax=Nitrosospira lacus TaxID=1288494 RepID=A0A1W6SQU8_9PROT|nr:hypothetical protein [Nitrosospira lacus]ARO88142.1 hypothetical protein EBAPG3_010350 [Nitrosospira lacus]